MATIQELLQNSLVDCIPHTRDEVVFVSTDTPLLDGFQKLLEQGIHSAPAWDDKTQKYIGFLDLQDLVSYCVIEAEREKDNSLKGWFTAFAARCFSEDGFQAQPQNHISYLAMRHPFASVDPGAHLNEVVKLLATKYARVALLGPDGNILNIISQTSIITFLDSHIAELEGLGAKSVSELNLGTRPCVSVKDTDSALSALKLIDSLKISGLAIVSEEDGTLAGNTSSSDTKLFLNTGQACLTSPVLDFFAQACQAVHSDPASPSGTGRRSFVGHTRSPTITCSESDPLSKVIARFAKTKVHHMYIVDDAKHPIGVITVRDICRLIASN